MLLPRRRGLYIKVLLLIPASWLLISLLINFNNQSNGGGKVGDSQGGSGHNGNGLLPDALVGGDGERDIGNKIDNWPVGDGRLKSKNRRNQDRLNRKKNHGHVSLIVFVHEWPF